jgi:hypothetical protein
MRRRRGHQRASRGRFLSVAVEPAAQPAGPGAGECPHWVPAPGPSQDHRRRFPALGDAPSRLGNRALREPRPLHAQVISGLPSSGGRRDRTDDLRLAKADASVLAPASKSLAGSGTATLDPSSALSRIREEALATRSGSPTNVVPAKCADSGAAFPATSPATSEQTIGRPATYRGALCHPSRTGLKTARSHFPNTASERARQDSNLRPAD